MFVYLYYISSFTYCENIDENTSLYVPVYYIVFTLIDCDNSDYIQKRYVENVENVEKYYYYSKKYDSCEYITNNNVKLFTWCLTKY